MVSGLALIIERRVNLALEMCVVRIGRLISDTERRSLALDDRVDEVHQIIALGLLNEDDRASTSRRVRAAQHVEVGEIGNGHTTIGMRTVLLGEILREQLSLSTFNGDRVLVLTMQTI